METGDKVMVHIPLRTCVKDIQYKRKYNRRIATITEVIDDRYKLDIDDGRNTWEHSLLAKVVSNF